MITENLRDRSRPVLAKYYYDDNKFIFSSAFTESTL